MAERKMSNNGRKTTNNSAKSTRQKTAVNSKYTC